MAIPQFPLFFPFIKMLAVAGFSFAFISIRMLQKKERILQWIFMYGFLAACV